MEQSELRAVTTTDSSVGYAKQDKTIVDIIAETVQGALNACEVSPEDVDVAHVSNWRTDVLPDAAAASVSFAVGVK